MTNTNTLQGIRCPRCGNDEAFTVEMRAVATVIDNGVDVYHQTEWDDDAGTVCNRCTLRGEWREFEATPTLTLGQLRKVTEHLDDSTQITLGGDLDKGQPDWLNLSLEHVPTGPEDETVTVILHQLDTFDTRQF